MFKKFTKKIAISTLLATSMFADSASISKDGLGDFLLAPVYLAKDDICSKVRVYNTNETSSFLAKVAIREGISSQEVDLPIFLSPGDVWYGNICKRGDDVYLTSIDDSNHPLVKGVLESGKNLSEHSRMAGHENIDFSQGYIEIYPIAQFYEGSSAKVDKKVLVKRWDALINGESNVKKKASQVDGYSLSGVVSYFNSNGIGSSSIPMKAFKGAHDRVVTGTPIAYSSDTSPDILLGKEKKNKILSLLQTEKTSTVYDNFGKNQFLYFTFPFSYAENQTRTFKATIRDMSENKSTKKTVIFSPTPVKKQYGMKNEVARISLHQLIKKTGNEDKFEAGMIQIKEITNEDNVQLGMDRPASFVATYFRFLDNSSRETIVTNSRYVPSK